MKKLLMLMILLAGLVFPWACSDNNSPSKPPNLITNITPTGTQTPTTPTYTPTLAVGANTYTPTPTFVFPPLVFQHNIQTTGSPNALVINSIGAGSYILTAAELQNTSKGAAMGVEEIGTGPGGTMTLNRYTGTVLQGFPTPNSTPPWAPVSTGLNGPQGAVNPGGDTGYAAILDIQSGGGALLYTGYSTAPPSPYNGWSNYGYAFFWEPESVSGYSGIAFNNPKGLTADTNNNIYVADTGNGFVEEFTGPALNYGVVPEHFWPGFAGVSIGGPVTNTTYPSGRTVTFSSPAVGFKSPYAVACDPLNNVWVADTGSVPSMISEYTSGATTILESWPAVAGSIVHGLAVDNSTNCTDPNLGPGPCVYVADSGANIVEVYSVSGTLMSEITNPNPSGHESAPFAPSCISFAQIGGQNYIFVGDSNNDFIDSFH